MPAHLPPFDNIVRGLSTKSDKIRELFKARYERSEIARLLHVRYQHVRNVLLQSGLIGRLREPRPVEREQAPAGPKAISPGPARNSGLLLDAGFEHLGAWHLGLDKILRIDAKAPDRPGVYAFVADDEVIYVGVTQRGLQSRLDGYVRGHKKQKTNARIKKLIEQALGEGKQIAILIATPDPLRWNGLPVNTAAGLEVGLIRKLRPIWNVIGANSLTC